MRSKPIQRDDLAHVRLERRELAAHSDESFDRIAFAMRAVRLLQPPGMTVAVYEGTLTVRIDQGLDLRNGLDAKWGMLAIPPTASRVDIVLAVARLAGKDGDPYVLDLLMAPSTKPV